MSKTNHIPGLTERPYADGRVKWHWKPSPRLRREGWVNLDLGFDYRSAVLAAIARNEEVTAFQQRSGAAASPQRTRANATFAELVTLYKADPAFTLLKPKTRAEYNSRLGQLAIWAGHGQVRVRHIDRGMCVDLRNTLVLDSRVYRTAAMLRVLRILLGFAASQHIIPANPAIELDIPEPPKRRHRLTVDQLPGLMAGAADLGLAHVALGVTLGFYTMQREGDLLATTAFRFRSIDHDISAEARRALAGPDGRVLALWLQQEKTGAHVAIPLIPTSRAAVEAAIEAARDTRSNDTHLFQKNGLAVQEWTFQRDFRKVCIRAAELATERQQHDLAAAYRALQFRDLRRSGMCWMRELGVPVAMIASISGHSIDKTMKILDTYMPRDTRAAAEGMAIAVTRQAERDAADKEEADNGG